MQTNHINLTVLDRYNGRDTVYLLATEGSAAVMLHWLMIGHVEDTDIWCQVPLSLDEAEDFINNVPRLLDGYLATLSPRDIMLLADPGHDPAITLTFHTGGTDTPAPAALQQLAAKLPDHVTAGDLNAAEAAHFVAHIRQVTTRA